MLGRHRIPFTLEGGGGERREQINSLAAQSCFTCWLIPLKCTIHAQLSLTKNTQWDETFLITVHVTDTRQERHCIRKIQSETARMNKMPLFPIWLNTFSAVKKVNLCEYSIDLKQSRHLTVLHLVPHTTCLWLSHWEANTLLSRPRENSLSLRMLGSLPAAKPRRLLWSLSSCCCWGLNSRPRRAHTTECRLHHHCWAWRDEQETRPCLCGVWHQPSWRGERVKKRWNAKILYMVWR